MPRTADLLALHGIGQRAHGYRFDLLDNTDRKIGELHPARDDLTPVITFDTSRVIARDMANLTLVPSEAAAVNPLSDRVRPSMVLEDGSEHPLGLFLFADASTAHYSYGDALTANLVDKGLILDQAVDHTVSIVPGDDPRDVAILLLADLGLASIVDHAHTLVGEPMTWPGGTLLTQILTDLGTNVGWLPPWFDHQGICRLMHVFDPDETAAGVDYVRGVYAESSVATNDLLHAVNRTIAISSDSAAQAFVGVYDVPAGAPHSFHARGFRVVEVFNVEGIGSQHTIDEAAKTLAQSTGAHRTTDTFTEHSTFSGAPDPRHDGYTVVAYRGRNWLEESWVLPLSPAGPMTHTLRRVVV